MPLINTNNFITNKIYKEFASYLQTPIVYWQLINII